MAEIFPEIMTCRFTNPGSSENPKQDTGRATATTDSRTDESKVKLWTPKVKKNEKKSLESVREKMPVGNDDEPRPTRPRGRQARRREAGRRADGTGGPDRGTGIPYPAKISSNDEVEIKIFLREKEAGRIHSARRNSSSSVKRI